MSDHDERDDYDDEPGKVRLTPETLVRGTAALVWAFGLFELATAGLCMVLPALILVTRLLEGPRTQPGDLREAVGLLIAGAVGVGLASVTMYGAARMAELRRYPWAVAAAILSSVPVPCLYLGVLTAPLGVWALILLSRADVRARFAANRGDTMTGPQPEATDARADQSP